MPVVFSQQTTSVSGSSSSLIIPEPWGRECNVSVPLRTDRHVLSYSLHGVGWQSLLVAIKLQKRSSTDGR